MLNITTAKEKAKALLRERSFADAAGFGWILTAMIAILFTASLGGIIALGITVVATLSRAWFIPGVSWYTALPSMILYAAITLVGAGSLLLFHGGMVRASLRIVRRDKKVRTIDILLTGDRLGHNICITLWIALYIFLWNLIGVIVASVGVWLIWYGMASRGLLGLLSPSITGYEILGWILMAAGFIWNCVINVIKQMEYTFSYHIAEDNRSLTAHACLTESSRLTKGQKKQVFLAYLSFLGWNILTCTLLVAPFTIPYQYLTFANLYEQLRSSFQPARDTEMGWQRNGSHAADQISAPAPQKETAAGIFVLAGEFSGMKFPLSVNEELRIGRDAKRSNIVLSEANRSISGLHCGICFNALENAYFVTDYSSNGTFVAGNRLLLQTPQRVERGTVVKLGSGEFVIRLA